MLYGYYRLPRPLRSKEEPKGFWTLIFKEKHSDWHFLVRNQEELDKVFLKRLTQRFKNEHDCWFWREPEEKIVEFEKQLKQAEMEKSAIEALGIASEETIKVINDKINKAKSEANSRKETNEFYDNVKKAVENQDAKLANSCMYECNSSGGYGEWELERLEVVDEES